MKGLSLRGSGLGAQQIFNCSAPSLTRHFHTNTSKGSVSVLHASKEDEPTFTTKMADLISQTTYRDLPDIVIRRSKRMILDALGIGVIGASTDISNTLRKYHNIKKGARNQNEAVVWGTQGLTAKTSTAAFLNGISTHSMDFDDTWHPPTHPSGAVLSALLALVTEDGNTFTTRDVLTAFNVGIQVQGLLLRCSQQAEHIPKRFHPPAVVGIMGSAAAASNLLKLTSTEVRHALAVAASYAGAPMANAGTQTKPFHAGKSAMCGLEAALLSQMGVRGNPEILEATNPGLAAFYDDYNHDRVLRTSGLQRFVLEDQDVAIKRYPAHLGMHWAMDAAEHICHQNGGPVRPEVVKTVVITAPGSKYIDRAIATNEHEARHSFQFNTCSMLLDGHVTVKNYLDDARNRKDLIELLNKTKIVKPDHITPSFDTMYVDVTVILNDGQTLSSVCNTPYGHWRKPLSDRDVEKKFISNTLHAISTEKQAFILEAVSKMHEKNDVGFVRYL